MSKPDTLTIFVLQLQKRVEAELYDELVLKVDRSKRERLSKFYKWQDAQRGLFADLLVRMAIMNSFPLIRNTDISFALSDYGKPALTNFPYLHFNVSHSGDWIVCAIDKEQVGIDVEQIGDIDLSISERFFFPAEHDDIMSNKNPLDRFFDYWTLKESYIKFIGKGLSHPLNEFHIKFFDNSDVGIETEGKRIDRVHFKQYSLQEGYKLAVCTTHTSFPDKIIHYTLNDILNSV